jgi:hypothetical protein
MSIERQVFIGGCGRSGTTLLGAMLGAHPAFICTPESHFKIDLLRSPVGQNSTFHTAAAVNLIRRHWRFKIWEYPLPADFVQRAAADPSFASLFNTLVSSYGHTTYPDKGDAAIWVDHTPENISYVESLRRQFPQAKFIHIVRDGRAVAASIMPLDWGPNSIVKAARWWMRNVSFGLAAELKFGPQHILRVQYENLLQDPPAVLHQISQFLGINYDSNMLTASGFEPPRYTTRQHTLVGRAPDPALATRWQKKLKQREIEIFEHLTYDFLYYMGYEPLFGMQAKAPNFAELQQGKLAELLQGEILNKIKWLIRSYPHWLSRDFLGQARFTDIKN